MKKKWIFAGIAFAVSIATASMVYGPLRAPELPAAAVRPLDEVMPDGALLYIEARNFSQLLQAWNSSPEKTAWLQSDSRSVFAQSRLMLRLQRHFQHFGVAAGVPANTDFVTAAAGEESALALYDIGKIQFVYVTHLHSRDFLNSALWQSRNKFPTRFAGGVTFFLGTDDESKQAVAFAMAGDYLVLATREDLMVRTLQLLNNQPERSIRHEPWYSAAITSAAKTPGDLRMVLDLEKIATESHFRTYWVQQNITEMQGYVSAISDLYCEGNVYREERVLLGKDNMERGQEPGSKPAQAVADLLRMVPSGYGFYQAKLADSQEVLPVLQQMIFPQQQGTETERQAPQVVLTDGEAGSESDLETKIDSRAGNESMADGVSPELKKQLDLAGSTAVLEIQGTHRGSDGVLLTMPNLLVVNAAQPWDSGAVQQAIRSQLARAMSVSELGFQWRQARQAGEYWELDGLHRLYLAVRGKFLFVSNQAEILNAALQSPGPAQQAKDVTYVAEFNHGRERENFYELTRILDLAPQTGGWSSGEAPRFFSRNIASLSRAVARLDSEKVVERQENDKLFQTVTYKWSH